MIHCIRVMSLGLALFSLKSWAFTCPADSTRPTQPVSVSTATAEVNVRVNYTSRAVFSGRDFGIREWMSTPSITYYAKSGFYADVSGYYFSQSQPRYELTALSAGYLGVLSNYFALSADVSRTILSQKGQQNLLPYSADATVSYNISPLLSASVDYNLLFGNATAHRARLALAGYISRKIQKSSTGLQRISFLPALTTIFGTETSAFNLYQPATTTTVSTATTAAARRLLRIQQRLQAKKNGTTIASTDTGTDQFGLMALDLSLPVRATFTGFRLGLTNHIVRPVKIYADEELSTDLIYYADVSLTWVIK